ncbi:selenide, water dikinase SelD [Candidatus Poribacteria bacterium]|nr:selenide, water dikinase SelD [Candidatus Poribacteria bacterium]MBT5536114.1 selenide, water dikinase SelD [Candidatus Poribacteria bacterium]MBT5710704.1 selenide, water dikinase SelD [Candidatus Poribacteria bacterium]MBT7804537.1 selenide, water dikinase SelD [Candidatus Poribacteria bacterium]
MLDEIVSAIPKFADPNMLVGTETADDAGVYRLSDDLAIINTVDYFTPIVDDPYTFGVIAVTNSLSDVYSMGGVPRTALNIVLWDKTLPTSALGDILRGGADTLHKAGCALVGGHSVEAPELMYGTAVTGVVHPDEFVRNCDAQVGDTLILSKPLGVGILTTSAKYDKISAAQLQPAIDSMSMLNDGAGEVLREFGAHAATDITGFGLLGHAHEMAAGSGLAIELHADAVPALDHVIEQIGQGVYTMVCGTNKEYLGDAIAFDDGVAPEWQQLLMEAETSGGLLLSVEPGKAADVVEGLKMKGCSQAAVVGRVIDGESGRIEVRA